MPAFEPGDIVRAPFPYTDRDTVQHRPALVVSSTGLGPKDALCWVVMITSAENRPWVDDVALGDAYAASGLPAPSVVRPAKIATLDAGRLTLLGRLPDEVMTQVIRVIARYVGTETDL